MEKFGVFWNRYDRKFQIEIGQLLYNENNWFFMYDQEGIEIATQLGFQPFTEFSEIQKVYTSNKLFTTFEGRISDNLTRQTPLKNEEDKIKKIYENNAIIETDNISLEPKEKGKQYAKKRH